MKGNEWVEYWDKRVNGFKNYCFEQKATFLKAVSDPESTEERVFQDIIQSIDKSTYWKSQDIGNLKSIVSFKKMVPIRSYNGYLNEIDEEINSKGGYLSNGGLVRFLKTSGTTNKSKRIPYTEHWVAEYRTKALGVLWASYLEKCPEILESPYSVLDTQTIREIPTEFENGIPCQGITNRNPLVGNNDWDVPWYNAPWMMDDVPSDYDSRMYIRIRYLIEHDVKFISAINPSTLIALHSHIIKNKERLINELKLGTVLGKQKLKPNPDVAQKLETFDKNLPVTYLWENLKLISCWTISSAALYKGVLDILYPNVNVLPFMTCGSEGVVTLPNTANNEVGLLAITQGLYEFLPAEQDLDDVLGVATPDTLNFRQLTLGKEYHLIHSQANGLLRQAVGDIFKVVGFDNGVPRLEFTRRNGIFHSFTGEKITETQMLDAIQFAYKENHLKANLFMCFPVWKDTPQYKIYIETTGNEQLPDKHNISTDIDQYICSVNEEYKSKRDSKRLDEIDVEYLLPNSIEQLLEQEKLKGNSTQAKYKPLQSGIETMNFLETVIVS
ncbi:GH3 family domain-containing protein [Vibrio mangrovi]|uniref:GH3 auxin-responsive promoter n=1 Tax=Vibrio mangrovi TaxID=474394 RepID=A0A1Y6IQB3_9VIBR|nr:GH3 auxin-responsive promoter family protein [Vibrio mangrovi]MDW6003381.1 GH3 auxin-responsive promoter family protein [Vibrio mangrovi]SMR99829.1 GH3 auxin-responsive promoter [Vibrio mangrovi]